jgi:hypothetical protein
LQGRGPDKHGGSWAVISPASPSGEAQDIEGDLSWSTLAAQIDKRCGTWEPFPADTLEVKWIVEVEERSSVGGLTGECSACRSTIT